MFFASPVNAQTYGLETAASIADLPQPAGGLEGVIGNVIGNGLSFIAIIFFGLVVFAGVRWMFSRGNSEEATKSLDTILAAIIGIIMILAAYAATNFVFDMFTDKSTNGGTAGTNSSNKTPQTSTTVTKCYLDCGASSNSCVNITYTDDADLAQKIKTNQCAGNLVLDTACPSSCGGAVPVVPSCTDATQNGDETGVDCGGSCSACPVAQSLCTVDADCGVGETCGLFGSCETATPVTVDCTTKDKESCKDPCEYVSIGTKNGCFEIGRLDRCSNAYNSCRAVDDAKSDKCWEDCGKESNQCFEDCIDGVDNKSTCLSDYDSCFK
ncbi:MAG: pilin [Candidatus Magasanikiibacteriota bacterium]